MPKKATPDASPVAQFEQSLDELEQLVEKMEHGEMSLEDSLAAYERGVGLYRRCQSALEQAELRVRLLTDPERPDDAQPWLTEADQLRFLLRDVFTAAGGTHDNWDEYDRVMASEGRAVVLIAPTRVYSNG